MGFAKCFGCLKSFDIFGWMLEWHNLTFDEAITQLAERYHFDLTPYVRPATPQELQRDRYYQIYGMVAEYCHNVLINYENVWAPYVQETGFSKDQVAPYKVGYCTSSNELINIIFSKFPGITNDDVQQLELTNLSMWNQAWVYPIHTASGQVASFRNKSLAGVAAGKYIGTSKHNPIFEEGLVYGLYQTKHQIRDQDWRAVIVEGQKAAIATRSMAVMGTNISEKQVETLRQYNVKHIVVAFDGDQAGYNASVRLLDEYKTYQGLTLKIAQLPIDLQPDTLIGTQGSAAWQATIEAAQLPVEFFVDNKLALTQDISLQSKYQIVHSLSEYFKALSSIEANFVATYLAERLHVDIEYVLSYIRSLGNTDGHLANTKAEIAVLHHLIATPHNYATTKQQLFEPTTFVISAHQWIYQATEACYIKHHGAYTSQALQDEIRLIKPTLADEIIQTLDQIVLGEAPAYGFEVAVQKVADLWRRRLAINQSAVLGNRLRDLANPAELSIVEFRHKLVGVVAVHDKQANTPEQLVTKAKAEMFNRSARGGQVIGMDFNTNGNALLLNRMLSGLQKGHMTVIAANQGAGKSLLALNMVKPIVIDQGIPWLWIPQEMTDNETMFRLASLVSGVDNNHIQSGGLNKEELERVEWAFAQIYKSKFYCYKPQSGAADEIYATIDDYRFRYGIEGVTWDYIQLVGPSRDQKGMSDTEIIGQASRMMKNDVAERMNICAMVIAQLNRTDYKEGEIRGGEHMGGAYRISQDCDDLLTVYKKTLDQINEEGRQRGNRKVHLNKRRGGLADFTIHCDLDTYDAYSLRYRECMTEQEIAGFGRFV